MTTIRDLQNLGKHTVSFGPVVLQFDDNGCLQNPTTEQLDAVAFGQRPERFEVKTEEEAKPVRWQRKQAAAVPAAEPTPATGTDEAKT